MKEWILKHKNKLLIMSPAFMLAMIIFGAFYVMSISPRVSGGRVDSTSAQAQVALAQFKNLDLQAKAYIVYDATRDQIIYGENELAQLPLASLTKIMSAVVALELAPRETVVDGWELGDLLKYTLVASSNKKIEDIASELSPDNFVSLMNKKAESLGLTQTFFLNESGLDVNETLAGAYGSARDVARLFDYALAVDPDVLDATKYDSVVISSAEGRLESALNTNQEVTKFQGLIASKTGFTDLAQGNLAVAFDVDGDTRVIVVVLGSTAEGRFTDALALARATFAYYSLI